MRKKKKLIVFGIHEKLRVIACWRVTRWMSLISELGHAAAVQGWVNACKPASCLNTVDPTYNIPRV